MPPQTTTLGKDRFGSERVTITAGATATATGASATKTDGSANATDSSGTASQTSGSSSSTSTGGIPHITANSGIALGGAVAALMVAL